MWKSLAKFVLKFRLPLLLLLLATTALMAYFASKVQLSYEFAKAIPTDNPKYQEYLSFREKFGEDGNLVVAAVQSDKLFELNTFKAFNKLTAELKTIKYAEDVLSVTSAINLIKNPDSLKLNPSPVFAKDIQSQAELDSSKNVFLSLPFYRTILYNPESNVYLIAIRINKAALASAKRTEIVNNIIAKTNAFTAETKIETHVSGLPLIKTLIADRIKREMKWSCWARSDYLP
jgi:uncharacterized protein